MQTLWYSGKNVRGKGSYKMFHITFNKKKDGIISDCRSI